MNNEEKEELIKSWNKGLTVLQVARQYAKDFNKKSKDEYSKEKMTEKKALEIIEPVLFKYRIEQLKGTK